jgi:sugar lactone lactonase YvrE
MSVEVLLKNITMGTGEGPYWEESTQSLLFVDIVTQYVRRWDYATKEVQEIKLGKISSDYPFGIFELRLLITPLVSLNYDF